MENQKKGEIVVSERFLILDSKERARLIKTARSRLAYRKCNSDIRVRQIREEYEKSVTKNELISVINEMLESKRDQFRDDVEVALLNM